MRLRARVRSVVALSTLLLLVPVSASAYGDVGYDPDEPHATVLDIRSTVRRVGQIGRGRALLIVVRRCARRLRFSADLCVAIRDA